MTKPPPIGHPWRLARLEQRNGLTPPPQSEKTARANRAAARLRIAHQKLKARKAKNEQLQ